jgi:glutamate synthase (NADPH) large chain
MSPMAQAGEEGTGSMGNDSPLAVLSDKNKPLYNYFKQLFAQVTNPPIDPIRENIVMSLVSFIGPKPNLLDINAVNPPMRLEVPQPVLDFNDMARLRRIEQHTSAKFKSHELNITYPVAWGGEGVEAKLASLCAESVDAIRGGHNILIISDRRADRASCCDSGGAGACRPFTSIWCARGCAPPPAWWWKPARRARCITLRCSAGYGAEAVHPYLAMETLANLHRDLPADLSTEKAIYNYVKAIGKGLSKIMSKMGVSTYMSYCGAQLFEAIGLEKTMVDQYFRGTATGWRHRCVPGGRRGAAHAPRRIRRRPVLAGMLDAGGEYAWRVRGEEHMWTPDAIAKLQHSTRANKFDTYKEYAQLINDQSRRHMTLRGLFEFKLDPSKAIPLDEVEPAAEIVKRFATGAMSLGSISTEAHSTLAMAMNRIGGKSNTGEGGEDPARYRNELKGIPIAEGTKISDVLGEKVIVADYALKAGDSLRSKIKQVASGRFGVTTEYLSSADQIQIKMAQGAKPGEGGQLPGGKVSDYIGFLRYSVPGVGLISPPPHHDIYSIEDLAQLIHDLKNANQRASISVKLVSKWAWARLLPAWPRPRPTTW